MRTLLLPVWVLARPFGQKPTMLLTNALNHDPLEVALLVTRGKLAVHQFAPYYLCHFLSQLLGAAALAGKRFGHHVKTALGVHILKADRNVELTTAYFWHDVQTLSPVLVGVEG